MFRMADKLIQKIMQNTICEIAFCVELKSDLHLFAQCYVWEIFATETKKIWWLRRFWRYEHKANKNICKCNKESELQFNTSVLLFRSQIKDSLILYIDKSIDCLWKDINSTNSNSKRKIFEHIPGIGRFFANKRTSILNI